MRAIDGVSFDVYPDETVGLVGESGCGKTVTGLSILGLIPSPPGRIVAGRIEFQGKDLASVPETEMRGIRGRDISMIFQEPMTALNPVFTIGSQMTDVLIRHRGLTRRQAARAAIEMLAKVGIPVPDKRIHEYPHQLSGGMRQRVMIAMALSCDPKLLVADEPTTALDVTTQAQVLEQINRLQQEFSYGRRIDHPRISVSSPKPATGRWSCIAAASSKARRSNRCLRIHSIRTQRASWNRYRGSATRSCRNCRSSRAGFRTFCICRPVVDSRTVVHGPARNADGRRYRCGGMPLKTRRSPVCTR